MSGIIEQLFGRQKKLPKSKSIERLSEEAYQKFTAEGDTETKGKSELHIVSAFEKSDVSVSDDAGNRSEVQGMSESYDPEKLKRHTFIESIAKDLTEFDTALTQNEMFVRQSREQLKRYKAFAQNAEVDLDVMCRLRTDNRGLTGDLSRSKKRVDSLHTDLESERAKSLAGNNRNSELRIALKNAREEIINLIERDTSYREKIEEHATLAVQRESELSILNRTMEKLSVENESLHSQCERFVVDLDSKISNSMELEKNLEESTTILENEQTMNEKLVVKNRRLTQNLGAMQAENVELQSRLQSAELEAEEFEKRVNGTNRIMEEEVYSLRARVDGLQSQLTVKSQVNRDLEDQTKTAHTESKVSIESAREMRERLVEALRQREEDQAQVAKLNTDISEQNKRFDQLLIELEQIRSENTKLRRSLKVQKQIWGGAIDETVLFDESSSEQQELEDIPTPPGSKTH